ncbi:deoxyribodipyrimidine photo-lyase [Natranaerobius thermophilus]|uniref:Deoxyribodipyrimidine photo-lyase n=1 Tax=Natranaerobius thermophilus (strain ATCC BAA-1301 / DSM 18059 / JW/NM-WN-LF) TaxID=457570 RepID=B2A7J6_NATTJ|nr:deoxyribodipyrimidine photo-lyase [Natranaerobius thermophilus]ACB85705.1 Deoxyribodipyrimidine photo-lyase [Natranaerobius thermophilus JW/NM-WN-LF]
MIHKERIEILQEVQTPAQEGKYVLYWMQKAQRTHYNHALEYAIEQANKLNLPLIVYFGLYEQFPYASSRHFQFMLQGLQDVAENLAKRNIKMIIKRTFPPYGAIELAKDASMIVVDKGYLKFEKDWKEILSHQLSCPIHQIETDAVIPVNTASSKEEYAAYTLRKKLLKMLDIFLTPLISRNPNFNSFEITNLEQYNDIDIYTKSASEILEELDIHREVQPVTDIKGGENQALEQLSGFLNQGKGLELYIQKKNDPSVQATSKLSPYLHFGQISPLFIALEVLKFTQDYNHEFLEQLIVRRELSLNLIEKNINYLTLSPLPQWSIKTLNEHRNDPRNNFYTLEEIEAANTHDKYFNAAQKELMSRGTIHNYIRMYWGKKIIEWSQTPEEAHNTLCHLNDKYALDGRDPNGYANILWCFGKHDRPFQERQIFGKVRYMGVNALKRNGKPDQYVATWV